MQKECEERVAVLVRAMAEVEGVDEEMKENEQMEWVRRMEMICGRAEEVVQEEFLGEVKRETAAGAGEFLLLFVRVVIDVMEKRTTDADRLLKIKHSLIRS